MVDELLNFIDSHWRKDHIFVHNQKLFDWQHKSGSLYNFVLARQNSEIVGILGFIPTYQYSNSLKKHNELWLSIWKVRDDINKPGLGLMMLNYLKRKFNNPTICAIGLSEQVIPLYKALKYNIGILKHRAFFNQIKRKLILAVPDKAQNVNCNINGIQYIDIKEINSIKLSFNLFKTSPTKNKEYIVNRYLNHPSYEYKFICFTKNNRLITLVVYRVIELQGAKIARVIDSFGRNIVDEEFNNAISSFIIEHNFEYLDVVSNLPSIGQSGFISTKHDFVIPNYFEPFEMRNIEIDFAYKSENAITIFKGDSDQDRPNL
jgi:hypothetical protein